jgi:hypothetical protein
LALLQRWGVDVSEDASLARRHANLDEYEESQVEMGERLLLEAPDYVRSMFFWYHYNEVKEVMWHLRVKSERPKGVHWQLFSRLPTYSEQEVAILDDVVCTICLGDFKSTAQDRPATYLICGHPYHMDASPSGSSPDRVSHLPI